MNAAWRIPRRFRYRYRFPICHAVLSFGDRIRSRDVARGETQPKFSLRIIGRVLWKSARRSTGRSTRIDQADNLAKVRYDSE